MTRDNKLRAVRRPGGLALLLLAAGLVGGCSITNPGGAKYYDRKDLVADRDGRAENTDRNLVNPWGLAYGPESYFWVSNNGTGTSTLYDGEGKVENDMVGGAVMLPAVGGGEASPTGMVYNEGSGFEITAGTKTGPARFLFATDEGTILGWNNDVDQRNGIIALDNSADESSYKGLAIARSGGKMLLYATNFHTGTVDVFDENFERATGLATDAFRDSTIPEGYMPFGIENLDGQIYVSWVKPDADKEEEVPGAGLGYIDVFQPDGELIDMVATGGMLNAPWGMAMAPNRFGQYGGSLLVGNFGDGRILAYDAGNYEMLGTLENNDREPITIDGLWALKFGNGREAGKEDELYFTAGTDGEKHGLFGSIRPREGALSGAP